MHAHLPVGPISGRREAASKRSASARTLQGVLVLLLLLAVVFWRVTRSMEASEIEATLFGGQSSSNSNHHPSSPSSPVQEEKFTHYVPSKLEAYFTENADALGYNSPGRANPPVCGIWTNESSPIYTDLQKYREELKTYAKRIDDFSTTMKDVREHFADDNDNRDVCKQLEVDPGGLRAVFPSGQLSLTPSGLVEPLIPPFRHPEYCFEGWDKMFTLSYIVHDFAAMCRKLKKTSRVVLVDMGAALDFHQKMTKGFSDAMPAVYLNSIFNRFGFQFDHIYAYEVTQTPPAKVFELVPPEWMSAYHWINVGVSPDPNSHLNPLRMVLDKFNEDDLVIVKLDIDTPDIEMALAEQLKTEDRFGKIIDHFYFEHHMHMGELARSWTRTMRGNVKSSMELFSTLRRKGIAAHYWV